MFESTIADLSDSNEFARAYTEPIRAAFRSLGFIDHDEAEDLTQDLILKLVSKDLERIRAGLNGPFRNWLYRCVRHKAIDALRQKSARGGNSVSFEVLLPIDPARPEDEQGWGPDVLYALSVFNQTLRQVRRYLKDQEKDHIWRIFEELVLAPMIPEREPRSLDEIVQDYPGRNKQYLHNCCTTVIRTIRRSLPAMIPPALTAHQSPEDRFEEWLSILLGSRTALGGQLHLAFATDEPWKEDGEPDDSIALTRRADDRFEDLDDEELRDGERRVLLGIWLTMPLRWYLGDPVVGAVFGDRGPGAGNPSLLDLLEEPPNRDRRQLRSRRALFESIKVFAKRVHRSVAPGPKGIADDPNDLARRACSMTPEIAQTLYDFSWAGALVRCNSLITSHDSPQLVANLEWLLNRSWLDDRARPVLLTARERLISGP